MNEIQKEMKIEIYSDDTEWSNWSKRGDSVLHIQLRQWAHIYLFAPLSANTLAKISNGLSDNLLTSIFRAWDFDGKHVIIAPAMNTKMWHNPFTQTHLKQLTQMFKSKLHLIAPVTKRLECNEIGMGAMAEPKDIAKFTKNV